MYRNIIELSDDTRIESGGAANYAIRNCTIIESVNSGDELTPGSACSACLDAQIIVKSQKIGLAAGQEIKLYKVDDTSTETLVGIFSLETPTKKSDSIYKITAYDRVSKLDKDLSAWLKALSGWPYKLSDFAKMVCNACGLTLSTQDFPNGDFLVYQFNKAGVTGRQLMQWIGEIACRFCRATAAGEIELAWYVDSGVTICATGDRYFFAGALTYEDYTVAPADGVQIRVTESTEGALWPAANVDNPYVIVGNPMLSNRITDSLLPVLQTIKEELNKVSYTPCRVSVPASLDIRAGHAVRIVDRNMTEITACVMTKTQTGQRDVLECTGSAYRTSSTAANTKTQRQRLAEQEAYSASVAAAAVNAQTQQDVFNKLTNNGAVQGFYVENNRLYVNAEFVQILNLVAGLITAGRLTSGDGLTYFDLDTAEFAASDATGVKVIVRNGRVKLLASDGTEKLVIGHNDANATFIAFGDLETPGTPRISVQDGEMSLQTVDVDDTDYLGKTTVRDYKVGWKYVNGEKVLVALI